MQCLYVFLLWSYTLLLYVWGWELVLKQIKECHIKIHAILYSICIPHFCNAHDLKGFVWVMVIDD